MSYKWVLAISLELSWSCCALTPFHMDYFTLLLGLPYSMGARFQEQVFQETEVEAASLLRLRYRN